MANVETAWKYFNCEEQLFRILIKNYDENILRLFSKRWGKKFDGFNATEKLKSSDDLKLLKYIENFKFDLEYVNFLLNNGTSLEDINRMIDNCEIGIIERYMVKYNVPRELVINCLDELNSKNRNFLVYYYGIGRKKFTIDQLCKMYDIDFNELEKSVQQAEICLSSYIRMKKDKKGINIQKDIKTTIAKPVVNINPNNKIHIEPKSIAEEKKPIEIKPIIEKTNLIIEEKKEDLISKKLNDRILSPYERLILYIKLKNINDDAIDDVILNLYLCSLDDMVMCYINNIDLFDDKEKLINQIINYDSKYIKNIFNSKFYQKLLVDLDDENRVELYESLLNKAYTKIKK